MASDVFVSDWIPKKSEEISSTEQLILENTTDTVLQRMCFYTIQSGRSDVGSTRCLETQILIESIETLRIMITIVDRCCSSSVFVSFVFFLMAINMINFKNSMLIWLSPRSQKIQKCVFHSVWIVCGSYLRLAMEYQWVSMPNSAVLPVFGEFRV